MGFFDFDDLGGDSIDSIATKKKNALPYIADRKKIEKIVDADTLIFDGDAGSSRILGYDAPESSTYAIKRISAKKRGRQEDWARAVGVNDIIQQGISAKNEFRRALGDDEVYVSQTGIKSGLKGDKRKIIRVYNNAGEDVGELMNTAKTNVDYYNPWNQWKRAKDEKAHLDNANIVGSKNPTGFDADGKPQIQLAKDGTYSLGGHVGLTGEGVHAIEARVRDEYASRNAWSKEDGPINWLADIVTGSGLLIDNVIVQPIIERVIYSGPKDLNEAMDNFNRPKDPSEPVSVDDPMTESDLALFRSGDEKFMASKKGAFLARAEKNMQDRANAVKSLKEQQEIDRSRVWTVERAAVDRRVTKVFEEKGFIAGMAEGASDIGSYTKRMAGSLPQMVALSNPYTTIPTMAGMFSSAESDNYREFVRTNKRLPNDDERNWIRFGSALQVAGEKLEASYLLGPSKNFEAIGLLAKSFSKIPSSLQFIIGKVGKGLETVITEGISGGTTSFGEEFAVKQDLSKIDTSKVFEGIVAEAYGGLGFQGLRSTKDSLLITVGQTNKSKLNKVGSRIKSLNKIISSGKDTSGKAQAEVSILKKNLYILSTDSTDKADREYAAEILARSETVKAPPTIRRNVDSSDVTPSLKKAVRTKDSKAFSEHLIKSATVIKGKDSKSDDKIQAVKDILYILDESEDIGDKKNIAKFLKENGADIVESVSEFKKEADKFKEDNLVLYSSGRDIYSNERLQSIAESDVASKEARSAATELVKTATDGDTGIGRTYSGIIDGTDGFIGMKEYIADAQEGKLDPTKQIQMVKFVEHLKNKAELVKKAFNKVKDTNRVLWLEKGVGGKLKNSGKEETHLKIHTNSNKNGLIDTILSQVDVANNLGILAVEAQKANESIGTTDSDMVLVSQLKNKAIKWFDVIADEETNGVIKDGNIKKEEVKRKEKEVEKEVVKEQTSVESVASEEHIPIPEEVSTKQDKDTKQSTKQRQKPEAEAPSASAESTEAQEAVSNTAQNKTPKTKNTTTKEDTRSNGFIIEAPDNLSEKEKDEWVIAEEAAIEAGASTTKRDWLSIVKGRFVKFSKMGGLSIGDLLTRVGLERDSLVNVMGGQVFSGDRIVKYADSIAGENEYSDSLGRLFDRIKSASEKISVNEDSTYYKTSANALMVDGKMPDEILYAMTSVAANWINGMASGAIHRTDHQISMLLYGEYESLLTEDEINIFSVAGAPLRSEISNIGSQISKIAGIRYKNIIGAEKHRLGDINNQTDLDAALGLWMFDSLAADGIIDIVNIRTAMTSDGSHVLYTGEGTPKSFRMIQVRNNGSSLVGDISNVKKSFDGSEKFFKKIDGVNVKKNDFTEEPSDDVQKKIPGSFSLLSTKHVAALTELGSRPFYTLNKNIEAFYELDENGQKILFQMEDESKVHVDRRASVRSKNNGIASGIAALDNLVRSGLSNKFYLRFKFMNQYRMLIDSTGINPLSNKELHRFMVGRKGVETTFNPKTEGDIFTLFKFSIVQALGDDIDKGNANDAIVNFDKTYSEYTEFLEDYEIGGLQYAMENAVRDGRKTPKGGHGLAGIVALASYHKYAKGKSNTVETSLGIEVDGITNGYAIGLVQFVGRNGNDNNNNRTLEHLLRVGLTPEEGGYENVINNRFEDAYRKIASSVDSALSVLIKTRKNKSVTIKTVGAVEFFIGGKLVDENSIVTKFARELVKHPFMIFNYSGGLTTIAKGMSEDVLKKIYKKIETISSQSEFDEMMDHLGTFDARYSSGGSIRLDADKAFNANALLEYSMDFSSVQSGIAATFKPVFKVAFKELTEPMQYVKDEITGAMEMVAYAFKEKFDREVERAKVKLFVQGLGRKKLSDFEKRKIADRLIDNYFPKLYGAWSGLTADGKQSFIDMVGKGTSKGNPVENKITKKNGKVGTSSTTTLPMNLESPGAKFLVRAIQNIDATVALKNLLNNDGVLSLHDAEYTGLRGVEKATEGLNSTFREVGKNYSIVEQTMQLFKSVKDVVDNEVDAVAYMATTLTGREMLRKQLDLYDEFGMEIISKKNQINKINKIIANNENRFSIEVKRHHRKKANEKANEIVGWIKQEKNRLANAKSDLRRAETGRNLAANEIEKMFPGSSIDSILDEIENVEPDGSFRRAVESKYMGSREAIIQQRQITFEDKLRSLQEVFDINRLDRKWLFENIKGWSQYYKPTVNRNQGPEITKVEGKKIWYKIEGTNKLFRRVDGFSGNKYVGDAMVSSDGSAVYIEGAIYDTVKKPNGKHYTAKTVANDLNNRVIYSLGTTSEEFEKDLQLRRRIGTTTVESLEDVNTELSDIDGNHESLEHKNRLTKLLNNLISPMMSKIDALTLTLNESDKLANGWFNTQENHITVNYSNGKPETYSEQSRQEVYLHELVHAVVSSFLNTVPRFREKVTWISREVHNSLTEKYGKGKEWKVFLDPRRREFIDARSEIRRAKEQYNAAFGIGSMQEFLAYGLSNKALSKVLEEIDAPKRKWLRGDVWYEVLVNLIVEAIEWIGEKIDKKKPSKNMYIELLNLTQAVTGVTNSKSSTLAKKVGEYTNTDKLDAWLKKNAPELAKKVGAFTLKGSAKVTSHAAKAPLPDMVKGAAEAVDATVTGLSGIANHPTWTDAEKKAAFRKILSRPGKIRRAIDSKIINYLFRSWRDLTGKLPMYLSRGITESNHLIEQARTQEKERIIRQLRDSFVGGEPSLRERKAMTHVLMRTEAFVLRDKYGVRGIIDMINDPKKLAAEITKEISSLKITTDSYWDNQIRGMAERRMSGGTTRRMVGNNLLVAYDNSPVKNNFTLNRIKRLTALISIQMAEGESHRLVGEVAKRELGPGNTTDWDGITATLELIESGYIYSKEAFKGQEKLMVDGYTSQITDPHKDVVSAPVDDDTQKMMSDRGYKFNGPHKENPETGLYYASNLPLDTQTKGLFSTTTKKHKGTSLIDLFMKEYEEGLGGVSLSRHEYAKIKKKYLGILISRELNANRTSEDAPRPIYNAKGEVVDFTYDTRLAYKDRFLSLNSDLFDVIGKNYGSITDKLGTEDVNKRGIKSLVDRWHEHRPGNEHEYINIMEAKWRDETFVRLPYESRKEILRIAGNNDGKFYVEEAYVDAIFGYRNWGLGELFKGERAKRNIKIVEEVINGMVGIINNNIVIKTPVVPLFNFASNFMTSTISGINPIQVIRYWREGLRELRVIQADMEALAQFDNRARVDSAWGVKHAQRRSGLVRRINANPTKELVDAGLYSAITTEGMHSDEFSYKNQAVKMLNKKIEEKFGSKGNKLINIVKGAYIAEDTAMYESMLALVQVSDFLGRYGVYKHMTEVAGKSKDEAYQYIQDVYVDFNPPIGKFHQYANSIGMIMFYKYFVRIQRPILGMIKHHPTRSMASLGLRSLSGINIPGIYDSGIITAGNFAPMMGWLDPAEMAKQLIMPSGVEIGIDIMSPIGMAGAVYATGAYYDSFKKK